MPPAVSPAAGSESPDEGPAGTTLEVVAVGWKWREIPDPGSISAPCMVGKKETQSIPRPGLNPLALRV